MLPMLPIFQRAMQFVVLSRPGINGVLPKGKDRRNTVAVEQGAAVNSWIILYFQLAAEDRRQRCRGRRPAIPHLGNTPSGCARFRKRGKNKLLCGRGVVFNQR
jgi:hypothetical protein